mmetsp:Transcript_11088/g.20051  ORF Transcript_11088/g.20051 Transcript_11088/m.20051 type:complete len:100 (+) Transcript_11088:31-330(+)
MMSCELSRLCSSWISRVCSWSKALIRKSFCTERFSMSSRETSERSFLLDSEFWLRSNDSILILSEEWSLLRSESSCENEDVLICEPSLFSSRVLCWSRL